MGSIAQEDEGYMGSIDEVYMGSIAPKHEEMTAVEVREASPAHYLLKIESFSLLSESGIEKFESKEFEAGGYKWDKFPPCWLGGQCYIYLLSVQSNTSIPLGHGDDVRNPIRIIYCLNEISIIVTRQLKSHDNYLSVRGKTRRFQAIKSLWGLPKFLSHKTLKEASNGYLVDDKCVLGAEIFVIQKQAIGEQLSIVKSNCSFKREWKISNFSNLGKEWLSENFTMGDYKWQLRLYPKGETNNKGCDISIYIYSVDAKDFAQHQKLKANCTINIKDQINGGCRKRSYCKWYSTTSRSWGYTSYMPLTQLHDEEKGYIVNDCIMVEVEMGVMFKHSLKSLS